MNPVITLVPGAGGLYTFNSDGSNDILQIQVTANPAYILYNSGGIGLASLTGVTRLVFNGNGGTDLLIVQSPPTPAPTHFAPINGIQFNGGGDAGDELDMIGGASTWTGTYNPTGVPGRDAQHHEQPRRPDPEHHLHRRDDDPELAVRHHDGGHDAGVERHD